MADRNLFSPIIFDSPSDRQDKGASEDSLVPSFCLAAQHAQDTSAQAPSTLSSAPELSTWDLPRLIPMQPVPAPPTPPIQQEVLVSRPAKPSAKLNFYDVAQGLMASLPMLIVDECLYAFDGQIYRPMTAEAMKRAIVQHCRQHVQTAGTPLAIRQIYDFLRAEPGLVRKGLQEDTRFVAFRNGLLNLETMTFGMFSPQYFVTAQIDANFIPDGANQCPVFTAFLSSISGGDPLLIQRFWEMIGYTLVPDTAGKVFFLAQGVPNSGKSLLGQFIASCFDADDVTSLDFNALGQQFGVSELLGKRLSLCMDLPGATWDTRAVGQLKSLTGNDLVSADVKYMPRIKFRNSATFILGTNHAVVTAEPDLAFFQRMVVLPFRYSIPSDRQDKFLLAKIQQEKDAIVTRAIYAYLRLRQNSYRFAGDFCVNEVIAQEPGGSPITGEQAVADFFARDCSVEDGAMTFLADLYAAFSCYYPGLLDFGTFSNRLFSLAVTLFPGQVKKVRKRRQIGGNPISAFEGLSLLHDKSKLEV